MMPPEVEIYNYRVFGNHGMGLNEVISISTAIYDDIEEGCDIINPDWASDLYTHLQQQLLGDGPIMK